MMPLDFSKPVQTRDGRKVRILCTDAECRLSGYVQPIVGLIDGSNAPESWSADGTHFPGKIREEDLVNVLAPKKTVQVEVRLYRDDKSGALYSRSVCQPAGALWDSTTGFISSATLTMEYTDEGAT